MNKKTFAGTALWLALPCLMLPAPHIMAETAMPAVWAAESFRAEKNVGQYTLKITPLICGVKIKVTENQGYDGERLVAPEVVVANFTGKEVARLSLADGEEYLVDNLAFNNRYTLRFNGKDTEGEYQTFAEETFNTSRPTFSTHFSSSTDNIKLRKIEVSHDESFVPAEIGVYCREVKYPFTGTVIEFSGLEMEQTLSFTPYVTYNDGTAEYTGNTIDVTTNAVEVIESTMLPEAYVDLTGRQYTEPQPGLNIAIYPDGTTRKILR